MGAYKSPREWRARVILAKSQSETHSQFTQKRGRKL
jgi:hypothetical protein